MPEFLDEKEKKMLELESRRGIYNIVREFAGCHFREIEWRSGLFTGLVKGEAAFPQGSLSTISITCQERGS